MSIINMGNIVTAIRNIKSESESLCYLWGKFHDDLSYLSSLDALRKTEIMLNQALRLQTLSQNLSLLIKEEILDKIETEKETKE